MKITQILLLSLGLISTLHGSMRFECNLSHDDFDTKTKKYIKYSVDLWCQGAAEAKVDTGLADIFYTIQKIPVDDLVRDQEVLKETNDTYGRLTRSHLYKSKMYVEGIRNYPFGGGETKLAEQLVRIIQQTAALKILIEKIPSFAAPEDGLLNFFATVGQESIPYEKECLTLNKNLDDPNALLVVKSILLTIATLYKLQS
jgi:hypothetical protein